VTRKVTRESPVIGMTSGEAYGRATRALIDLDAYEANVRYVRDLVSPGTEVMAVVKADAYGHGAVPIAEAAIAAGATRLAVATVGEGAALRAAGIAAPVVLLGPIDLGEAATALRLGLQPTIGSLALLDAVADAARRVTLSRPAELHLKVDTGMRRYGVAPDEALALARRIARDPFLELVGCSTHFAAADAADDRSTREQAARFDRCLTALRDDGIGSFRAHAANSAATLRSRRYDYDLVRPGVALFGLRPSPEVPLPSGMRPVMSIHSRIARLVDLAPGDAVGYGGTYVAAAAERVALVPIGYGDGYRRSLSGRGWMGIGGRTAPVRGRVSMDQTVVAVPDGVKARVGDEVAVLHADARTGAPDAETFAELIDSIPYEVVTGIAARVPRLYARNRVANAS
jgi:alanine racemase